MLTTNKSASAPADLGLDEQEWDHKAVIPRSFYDSSYADDLYWADRSAYYDYLENAAERFIEFGT